MLVWQVDTKPTEEWGDIGGLDKQIQELMEVREGERPRTYTQPHQ